MSEHAVSCVRSVSPRLGQAADLAVAHPVVDEVKKFAGRRHPGHVGAPALFDPGVELGDRGVATPSRWPRWRPNARDVSPAW